ncbi:putative Sugar phosphate exchanger 2 [Tripterygium wilfordii]|uniref:Putative Sugar phosphate exchanger 2 n=1 Tax=Tripterygium wilfordii TaxID=458696 RepID=A0A7J7CBA5_TRIWF|nr:uncharacterized protein LOC119984256 [Tripterygium wilfordii]KAF5731382.1 putative Sugar phosphate exchanger 2 [Tripterygium wilfordii]
MMTRRNSDDIDAAASFTNFLFELFEDGNDSNDSCQSSDSYDDFDEEDEIDPNIVEEDKDFWEDQYQLLHATLYRTTAFESRIRQATKDAVKELNLVGVQCICRNPVAGSCRNCLRKEVSVRLQDLGFNCAIYKSKWRRSMEIPSGEHRYLEVIDKSSSKKGEVRVVIELNFRAEFEMARASNNYNQLLNQLPEIFVGKAERLGALIKILCGAAKRCMKEKNMHLGPWRKHKYMQAKWFGTCEQTTPGPLLVLGYSTGPVRKPRASMLIFD